MPRRNVLRIDEKTRAKDVSGKVYIVTGANSGVGLETTRQLVKQGGHVVMACRRTDAGEEVAKSFSGLKGSYEVMRLDLADLQSVRDFAAAFLKKYDRLDGLACNAGLASMVPDPQYTKDGFELTIGVSYFTFAVRAAGNETAREPPGIDIGDVQSTKQLCHRAGLLRPSTVGVAC